MAELVISSALGKLERLQVDEAVPLPAGAKEQMKNLRNYLRTTLDVLKNSGLSNKKLREGSIHHHWMSEVVDIAHDVDVAIDIFIFHLEKSRRKGELRRRFASSAEKVRRLDNIFIQIDTMVKKIEKLKVHTRRESSPTRSTNVQPQGSAAWIQESDVVGLYKDVECLLQKVIFSEAEEGVSASCIVGMGGVGKTTLAKLLYNHQRVEYGFPYRAWVYVSSEFSQREVFRQLVVQLGMEYEEMMALDDYDLRRKVSEHLKGKRYFIVLDDVWRHTDLEIVMSVFHHQDKASRLLLTSRTRNIIGHDGYIHEMKILDSKESWQLFLKTVFDEHTKCPNELEEIGRKILTKCNGLPLAIVVVGSQLSNKKHLEKEWERFLESMDLSVVSAVLELSYYKLPPKLKSCFLSLGFFKEGTTVRVEKLVHFWSTGGMLSQGKGKDEMDEEIERKYLDELINQYMVEVKDFSSRGYRVKNCCINNNLHRLAVAKAEEEIRFDVIENDGNNRAPYKPRHGAVNCSREKFNYSTNQVKHLVSLFFRGGDNFDTSPSYWKSFELLKILDFEGFGLKTLPEMVGKLVCLEYLGLRNNFLEDLPHSLRSLKRLEVLDIALNFMVKLPDIIRKMDSLRHFYVSDIICWKPLKIDTLKNLQTLTYISVDNWIHELSGLEMMNSLRKLGIEELDEASDISKILASLAELENLDCLILRGSPFRSMPSLDELFILRRLNQLKLDGLLTMSPSAIYFPRNIRYLTLANTSLDEDPMPVLLEKLPNLVFLKLRNAFTGEQMVVSEFGFAELEVLCIEELWNLSTLQVGKGAMRRLCQVEINNCPYLKTLPEEIGSMAYLEKLKMVTPKGISRKISESGLVSKIKQVDIQL